MTAPYLRQQIQRERSFLFLYSFRFLLHSAENIGDHFNSVKQLIIDCVTVLNSLQLRKHFGKLTPQRLEHSGIALHYYILVGEPAG